MMLSFCNSLSLISFETNSELIYIESNTFADSSLTSITIPRHVRILCSGCFAFCKSLSSISFETDSELTSIEAKACAETDLSLVFVAQNIAFTANSAFPSSCAITLVGSACGVQFRAWNRCRQLGLSDVFERRAFGMGELATKESVDGEKRKKPSKPMGKLD
jgi:hypothetical protein